MGGVAWFFSRADDARGASAPIPRHATPSAKPYLKLVPDHADLEGAALVARLQASDATALETLIDRYAERLHRVAWMILRSDDEAADAVQDAFVAIWDARARLDPTRNATGYLFRAVRNHALKIRDREATQQRIRDEGTAPTTETNAGEASVLASELSSAMHRVLRTLQPRVREIFLMHRMSGMSYAEIAATLGVGVATVHSQMSRAVRRIAETLDPLDP